MAAAAMGISAEKKYSISFLPLSNAGSSIGYIILPITQNCNAPEIFMCQGSMQTKLTVGQVSAIMIKSKNLALLEGYRYENEKNAELRAPDGKVR